MKRITGGPKARLDYLRLRNELRTSDEDLLLAYVVTPIIHVRGEKVPVVDDSPFEKFLRDVGFTVRVHHSKAIYENRAGIGKRLHFEQTFPTRLVQEDALQHVSRYDRVVVVSGSGHMIPVAEKARIIKKPVVVMAFQRSGDLNPRLAELATEVIGLDASYRFRKEHE